MATTTPKKAAKAAEETSEPSSQDRFSSYLKATKDEHFAYVMPKHKVISTGSLVLDSLVKVRSGGVVRLLGLGQELGKTSEALVLAANYMTTMPKARTLYIKAEARLTPEMMKRSGLKWVFKPEDWVDGTVFVWPVNVFEVIAEWMETELPLMFAAGEHVCIVLDSLDGLQLRSDRAKQVWATNAENEKVAGVPKITKLLFRRLGLPITHYDVLMLITSQYSVDIKLDQYAPVNPRQGAAAGGNSVAHQSDYAFQYQPRYGGDYILEKPKEKPDWRTNRTLGVYATIDIKKSGTDVTGAKVRVPVKRGRIGNAIWVEREIVDMLLSWQMLAKEKGKEGSSWLHFDPKLLAEIKEKTGAELPAKINGENQAYKLLEDTPAVIPFLFAYFTSLNGGEAGEGATA